MTLLGLVLKRCGFLLLSRPAGRLSTCSERRLRGALLSCDNAVLVISRSECFVGGLTASVVRLAPRNVGGCVNGCSRCVSGERRATRPRGRGGTPGRGGCGLRGRHRDTLHGLGASISHLRKRVRSLRSRVTLLRRHLGYGPPCRRFLGVDTRLRRGSRRHSSTCRS